MGEEVEEFGGFEEDDRKVRWELGCRGNDGEDDKGTVEGDLAGDIGRRRGRIHWRDHDIDGKEGEGEVEDGGVEAGRVEDEGDKALERLRRDWRRRVRTRERRSE